MKKLLLALMIVGFIACESTNNTSVEGGFDLEGFETEKVSGTNTSYVFKKNADGNIVEEGYISNGIKNGQWITYDPAKGSVSSIESFINGKLNGYSFKISNRGYVDEQIGFINGNLEGKYFKYRYGRPKFEAFYADGELNGIKKEFYDNGKIQQETEYKNGVQNGIYKYYSDDGLLQMSYIYKNGEKVEGGMVEHPEQEETTK